MTKLSLIKFLAITPLVAAFAGCAELPGERRTQGAVIGGAAGAATGAAVAKGNRGLGALIGGILGAGGGYVIAAKTDKIDANDQEAATTAARKAQENPATPADARKAMTADLNYDGFVTLDEVVAMKQAGFTDQQMIDRLKATDQLFDLTQEHEKFLADNGINQTVIAQMKSMNRTTTQPGGVIGKPAGTSQ